MDTDARVELVAPTVALHEEWLESHDEWPGAHHPGAGSAPRHGLDLRVPSDFASWVDALNAQPAIEPTLSAVPATCRWMVRGGRYLGAIQLRHQLTEILAELGGHIGYHVRPSERRRGVARAALRQTVAFAGTIGLSEVLVTCDEDNIASRRTAESAGGRLTRIRPVDEYAIEHGALAPKCHYWIPTGSA